MYEIIENLILDSSNKIRIGNCFDSHFITKLLIEKYSDDYFKFVSKYISVTAVNIATTAHAQIGREIQKLSTGENAILEQMDCCKSVSFNLHKEISECTLWKRIK